MTYKDTAPPQAKQVVSHTRNPSDVLLATFRNQHNETEEKIPFSKKVRVFKCLLKSYLSSKITWNEDIKIKFNFIFLNSRAL